MKKILCVIVDHNKPEMTKTAFEAVIKNRHHETELSVLVVNNGKKYNEELLSYYHKKSAILLEIENKGFANAVNHGLAKKVYEYYWLINNDAIPDSKALKNLINSAEEEEAGIVSSMLINPDGSCQGGGGGKSKFFLYKSMVIPNDEKSHIVHMVYGASMLIKKDVIDRIGLFDERFFMYCEENDFCLRANKAGIKIVCATSSKVMHEMGGSIGQGSKIQKFYFMRNIILLHRKHSVKLILILNYIYHLLRILTAKRYEGVRFKCIMALTQGLKGVNGQIKLL